MKFEKLNENQIRCTLTQADLANRQLKISELAYGSEKARGLFKDMMQKAASELDFQIDDAPLMIEAISSAPDSIVLIITKVDSPEELDQKFARYTSALGSLEQFAKELLPKLNGLEPSSSATEESDAQENPSSDSLVPADVRLFSFGNLGTIVACAKALSSMYSGDNTLYKDKEEGLYLLCLSRSHHTEADFHKVCNMISEYGTQEALTTPVLAFLNERFRPLLQQTALSTLSSF